MIKKTWFISDLHLDPTRPQLITLLHEFLDDIQNQASALYILGDLFEFWVGDDVVDSVAGQAFLPVINHLRQLSDQGVQLYFTQGNRDFLIRQRFISSTGARLLADIHKINLYGVPTILLHGDTLCTDDKNYQRMRRLFRTRFIQNIYLSLSLKRRSGQASRVRKATRKQTQVKHNDILDVNQQAVEQLMRNTQVTQMIHGHTHRPAVHEFELDGKKAIRYVLGDWHDRASFLEASPKGLKLVW